MRFALCLLLILATDTGSATADDWPQFRGVGGRGLAESSRSLPTEIGPDSEHIAWKIAFPPGHSSPVLHGKRLFLTAVRDKALVTIAVSRSKGKILWEQKAPYKKLEEIHAIGSHAQPSPATDGKRVVSLFGSSGLYCHDVDGRLLWKKEMGPFNNDFGAGTSPVIVDDLVITVQDHDTDSFLAAYDKKTGRLAWKTDRSEFPRNYCSPVIWTVGGKKQVIVAATLRVVGYDLKTGKEIWSLGGMTSNCIPSPIISDGVAYLMSGFRGNKFQAVKLAGAKGDLDESKNVLWELGSGTSYVPSALLYQSNLYFLRSNSGVLTCVDAKSGKPHYEGERLSGMRTVYASPVGAGGHVYVTSRSGVTKVIKAGAKPEVVATNELDDTIDGSAAVVGDVIYFRGRKNLYCIGATKGN